MRRGVTWTKTTLAADEILQCRCRSGWRILAGRLFQSRGPAAAKLRSPNRVLVRGTQHVSMSADRSRRRPAWDELTVIDKIRCRYIMKCLVDHRFDCLCVNMIVCVCVSCWIYEQQEMLFVTWLLCPIPAFLCVVVVSQCRRPTIRQLGYDLPRWQWLKYWTASIQHRIPVVSAGTDSQCPTLINVCAVAKFKRRLTLSLPVS